MSSAKDPSTSDWPRDHFQFELQPRQGNGGYSVKAVSLPQNAQSPAPVLSARAPSDLSFNLSGVLGNNNGKFHWGRSFFEKTAQDVPSLELDMDPTAPEGDPSKESAPKSPPSTFGHVLKAYLLDLNGKSGRNRAQIDLHDKLVLRQYKLGGETYHRLTERDDVRSTEQDNARTPRRTLVLCFDGTSNHFSDKNTNVVKLAELLKKDDPERQMVYYQTGVGTYSPSGFKTRVGRAVDSALDEGVAWHLYQHVIDGYKFLMQTYRAGDKIALFGFSRGAFTARALAGMLHCVGLLPAHNLEHVAFAYEVYRHVRKGEEDPKKRQEGMARRKQEKEGRWNPGPASTSCSLPPPAIGSPHTSQPQKKSNYLAPEWLDPKDVEPEDFKRTFSVPVVIDFVGVWDTVASVGALWMREFRWIEYNPSILVFRQALALDERRGNFIPSLWDHRLTNPEMQDAREVWFRGEHCDVGGGSAAPKETTAAKFDNELRLIEPAKLDHAMLSNISLRWMVRQLLQFNTGILLDPVVVRHYQENSILETPLVNEMAPMLIGKTELETQFSNDLDRKDVKAKLYKSIEQRRLLWYGLEYLGFTQKPIKVMSPRDLSKRHLNPKLISATTRCPNSKTGRSIYFATKESADPDPSDLGPGYPGSRYPIYIHSSAVNYMRSGGYTPRATWYGYEKGQWPRIEFTPPRPGEEPSANDLADEDSVHEFLTIAQNTLNKVSEPGKDKQLLWREYRARWRKPLAIGACAVLATVWLIFLRPRW